MPRQVQPCGTDAAFRRHQYNHEIPDQACCDAHAAAEHARRLRKRLAEAPPNPAQLELDRLYAELATARALNADLTAQLADVLTDPQPARRTSTPTDPAAAEAHRLYTRTCPQWHRPTGSGAAPAPDLLELLHALGDPAEPAAVPRASDCGQPAA
jgi:hypothetical protein